MKKQILAGYLAALLTFSAALLTFGLAVGTANQEDFYRFGSDNLVQDAHKLCYQKSSGAMSQLVLFVRFGGASSSDSDLSGSLLTNAQMAAAKAALGDGDGSFSQYVNEATKGQIQLHSFYAAKSDQILSVTLPGSRKDYQEYHFLTNRNGWQDEGERENLEQSFISQVFVAARSLPFSQETIDQLDAWDENGVLDAVTIVVEGESKEIEADVLAPHAGSGTGQTLFGKELGGYTILQLGGAKDGLFGTDGVQLGQMAHPFFHLLGLPDLYDPKNPDRTDFGWWDVMGDTNLKHPQPLNAYFVSELMGWQPPLPQITQDAAITLSHDRNAGNTAYAIPISGTRQQIILEYREEGVLVYRVNGEQQAIGNALGDPAYYVYRKEETTRGNETDSGLTNALLQPGAALGTKEDRDAFAKDALYDQSGRNTGITLSGVEKNGSQYAVSVALPENDAPILTLTTQQVILRQGEPFDAQTYLEKAQDSAGNDLKSQVTLWLKGAPVTQLDTSATGDHLLTYQVESGGLSASAQLRVLVVPAVQPEDLTLTQNGVSVQLQLSSVLSTDDLLNGCTLELEAEPADDAHRVEQILDKYLLPYLNGTPEIGKTYRVSLYKVRPGSRQLLTQFPKEVRLTLPITEQTIRQDVAFLQIKDSNDFTLLPVTVSETGGQLFATASLTSFSTFTPLYGGNVVGIAKKGFVSGNLTTGIPKQNFPKISRRLTGDSPLTGDQLQNLSTFLLIVSTLLFILTMTLTVLQEKKEKNR